MTFTEGIRGVQYGTRPVRIDSSRLPRIREVAIAWLNAFTETIKSAIEHRQRTIAASPTVFAAIGAMGHALIDIDDPERRTTERNRLLDQLRAVNWDRGKAWEGIAGKFTPRGQFSVGGSKETAYGGINHSEPKTSVKLSSPLVPMDSGLAARRSNDLPESRRWPYGRTA